MSQTITGALLYENPLAGAADLADWRLEGDAKLTWPAGRLRMENALDPERGQAANFVLWCPVEFPDGIRIDWDFWPLREPGLCMIFFAARGRGGKDLFDPSFEPRTGQYAQYHSGDMDALHASYFRRKHPTERAFHTCNLRKSRGFHMVAQGPDPIPNVEDATPPYHLTLTKAGPDVSLAINDMAIFHWRDAGLEHGPVLGGGRIGLRQMAPLIGEYANLTVRKLAD